MSITPPIPGTPYARLGRTATHRWWLQPLSCLTVLTTTLVAGLLLYGGAELLAGLAGAPVDADGTPRLPGAAQTAVGLLGLATGIPVVLLAARLFHRRPAGTVSSVTGGLRWGWLGRCVLAAVPAMAAFVAVMAVVGGMNPLEGPFIGWRALLPLAAMLVVIVPLQAAGEEYLFRGWLIQSLGAYRHGLWPATALSAVLFAGAHGLHTVSGFLLLVAVGLVYTGLTVRTGGLEAGIAMHSVNNVISFLLIASSGQIGDSGNASAATWGIALANLAAILVYAAVVLGLARRRGLTTTVPARTSSGPPVTAAVVADPAVTPVAAGHLVESSESHR